MSRRVRSFRRMRAIGALCLSLVMLFCLSQCVIGGVVTCQTDQDCTGSLRKCAEGKCRACVGDLDCGGSRACVNYICIGASGEQTSSPDTGPVDAPQVDRTPGDSSPQCQAGDTRACFSGTNGCTRGDDGTFACQGICQAGQETCANGRWSGICSGEVLPREEVCNNKDDNCNGTSDDSTAEEGQACQVPGSKGECARGTYTGCQGGKLICSSNNQPMTEICDNGKDDDCDGQADETPPCSCRPGQRGSCFGGTIGCTKVGDAFNCVGVCRAGSRFCDANGNWGPCRGDVASSKEMCDGKDNDCNGKVDDTFPEKGSKCVVPNAKGECLNGNHRCEKGVLTCVSTHTKGPEVCGNGKDDNCDGGVDESPPCGACTRGEKEPCYTATSGCLKKNGRYVCEGSCQSGTRTCAANGKWGSCAEAVGPTKEVCDGKDNDCNGRTDDAFDEKGQSCSVSGGQGECAKGTYTACTAGKLVCTGAQPTTEVCDGKDNDCNGQVDDGCSACTPSLEEHRITSGQWIDDRGIIAFHPGNSMVALGSVQLSIVSLNTGTAIFSFPANVQYYGAAFSPDGKLLVVSDRSKVALWSVMPFRSIRTFAHSSVEELRFRADSKSFVTYSRQSGTAVVWEVATGKKLRTVSLLGATAATFNKDATQVAGLTRTNLEWFDLSTGTRLGSFRVGSTFRRGTAIAWSPDGKTFAIGDLSGRILLYSQNGNQRGTLNGHNGDIMTLAFGPFNQLLASGEGLNSRQSIRIWNVSTGAQLQVFSSDEATRVAFSPNGDRLAGTDEDFARIWSCPCTTGKTRPCYSAIATTKGVGPCKGGIQTCGMQQTWGACVGEVTPQREIADQKDNDCDGKVDEDTPELKITKMTVTPTTGIPGSTAQVSVCTQNQGIGTTGAFKIRLVFSNNSDISLTNDVPLTGGANQPADISYTSMKGGAAADCKTVSITIPNTTRPTSYVGAVVDFEQKVDEYDESNNTSSVAYAVKLPNLVISSITRSPTSGRSGNRVSMNVCTANTGTRSAGAFKVRLYFSTNSSINSADTALTGGTNQPADISYTSMAAGASNCKAVTVVIPSANPGTRYLGAHADFTNTVAESSESNTRSATFIIQGPDLEVSSLTLTPVSGKPGAQVSMRLCVVNKGALGAGAFKAKLYYSTNSIITTSIDTALTGGAGQPVDPAFQSLPPNGSQCVTTSVILPANAAVGTRYLGVYVDLARQVTEMNEGNNTKTSRFQVQ